MVNILSDQNSQCNTKLQKGLRGVLKKDILVSIVFISQNKIPSVSVRPRSLHQINKKKSKKYLGKHKNLTALKGFPLSSQT